MEIADKAIAWERVTAWRSPAIWCCGCSKQRGLIAVGSKETGPIHLCVPCIEELLTFAKEQGFDDERD